MCASLKYLYCIQTLNKVFIQVLMFSKVSTKGYGWERELNGFQTRAWAIRNSALLIPTSMLYLPSLHLLVSRLRYDGEQKGKSKTGE